MRLKRTILTTLLLCFSIMLSAQVQEHKVNKGETLDSIAQKYGVEKDSILELNPSAKKYFYIGMVLKIPVANQESSPSVPEPIPQTQGPALNEKVKSDSSPSRWEPNHILDLRAFYMPVSRGFGIGVEAYDIVGLPIGVGLGYWSTNQYSSPLSDFQVYAAYSTRFGVLFDNLYVNPCSGIAVDFLSSKEISLNKVGVTLRLNPTVGYVLYRGLSLEVGALMSFFNFKSFGFNMTLGVSYQF